LGGSGGNVKKPPTATPYAARVFGLRMWAVKKSMKRSEARSPALAIIAGTGSPVAGSMMVPVVWIVAGSWSELVMTISGRWKQPGRAGPG
jgi:hypothetical protein